VAKIVLIMLIATNSVLMYDITSVLNRQYDPNWGSIDNSGRKAHYIGRMYVYSGLIWLTTAIGCLTIDAYYTFCTIWGVIVLILMSITSFLVYRYRPVKS